ncbi:MAG: hypothetical protein K6C12_05475, partial [Oscillospiraceae bacterium]|nr:hypothetical protein [Oscillospiraceae bacterium]
MQILHSSSSMAKHTKKAVEFTLLAPGGKGHSEPERKGQFWPDEKGQTRLILVRFTYRWLALQVLLPV